LTTIEGRIDELLSPRLKVKVAGLKGTIDMEAIVDTGFNGDLCMPTTLAVQIGLILEYVHDVELADGSRKRVPVYSCNIELNDLKRRAEVILTDGTDALIGANMLKSSTMTINYKTRKITVTFY
jgi:clan AA aspartic protease